jgi:prepilin peptidase CpaA
MDSFVIDKAFLHDGVMMVAALTMIVAALSDFKKLIISNRLCLFLAALFPLFVLTAPHDIAWTQHLMIAGIVLVIGIGMFAMNLLGGGDVKMLAAAALWVGPKMIATLLLFTTFAGGILAFGFACVAFWRARKAYKENTSDEVLSWYKSPVPYGVAIACGGVTALFMMAQAV